MGRRPLRLRKPRGSGEQAAALVVACAVLWLLATMAAAAWHAATRVWPWLAAFIAAAAVYGAWRMLSTARARRGARRRWPDCGSRWPDDALDDQAFEFALRDLLIRDWLDGPQGRPAGRPGRRRHRAGPAAGRIVLQAKHTRVAGKVGSAVMYQVKGTAGPVHGADIAVVVTNGSFTRDARAWGEQYHVYWVDRDRCADGPRTAPRCRTCSARRTGPHAGRLCVGPPEPWPSYPMMTASLKGRCTRTGSLYLLVKFVLGVVAAVVAAKMLWRWLTEDVAKWITVDVWDGIIGHPWWSSLIATCPPPHSGGLSASATLRSTTATATMMPKTRRQR